MKRKRAAETHYPANSLFESKHDRGQNTVKQKSKNEFKRCKECKWCISRLYAGVLLWEECVAYFNDSKSSRNHDYRGPERKSFLPKPISKRRSPSHLFYNYEIYKTRYKKVRYCIVNCVSN